MAISQIGGAAATSAAGASAPSGMGSLVAGYSSQGVYTFTPKNGSTYAMMASSGGQLATGSTSGAIASANGYGGSVTNSIVTAATGTLSPITAYLPWSKPTSLTNTVSFGAIRFLNNQFLLGDQTGQIWTSPDGITWTPRSQPVSASVADFAWNGSNLYMAVFNGGQTATSPDGITWTVKTTNAAGVGQSLVYVTGNYFLVQTGAGNTQAYYTSTDGTTWTVRTGNFAGGTVSLAYSGSALVGLSSGAGTSIETSTNGVSWSLTTAGFSAGFTPSAVYFLNGSWWALGRISGAAPYTPNLYTISGAAAPSTTWTQVTLPSNITTGAGTNSGTMSLAYGNSTYVLVNQLNQVWTSTDGTNWTPRGVTKVVNSGNSGGNGAAMAYGGGRFVSATGWNNVTGTTGGPGSFAVVTDAVATIN